MSRVLMAQSTKMVPTTTRVNGLMDGQVKTAA